MTGEYPYLYHRMDFPDAGYDGMLEAGMTICVESYIGKESGTEGVKLEEQVLITESGIEVLATFPFDEDHAIANSHGPNQVRIKDGAPILKSYRNAVRLVQNLGKEKTN